ncbi:cytochrome c oxidase biogenesis protein Cmc1 like-domain-containing protein [Hypoxylon fragiforme]|uniref:cytochrome c oxidase biogenesis protein Cmc1 like-domain-containing protein n=1 Tax=Hypoxylon fragiforme TaxID=63214 RepID=UPI0020C647A6|nr:cytochrome c oxidase biogenesis protein Cmc1 like-domain-containing protein [Hypoxylon fragiforme]KAI2604015.1 cytochrome c oxidase biogenesis protein Cmc1 like-domain-containing protein [Hypoxylon fragiforme]
MAAQQSPIPPAGGSSSSSNSRRDNNERGAEGGGLGVPSRNPIPLSASQEAQVREVFNARVRSSCADEIKAFADCARTRTFTIPFACRDLSHRMNSCMLAHSTPEEHDRAREQWFAQRQQRAKEREAKERRKIEQEAFHREWWGIPQRDPEEIKKELEKLERAERVGGMTARRPGGGADGEGR